MKGGTGLRNPQLSTLLLLFRHEPRLQPAQTARGWMSRQPAPATQRRGSPSRQQRWEQARGGPHSQTPPRQSRLPRLPTGFLKTSLQRQDLAESWGQQQGWSSKNKMNLFRSSLGHS